MMSTILWALTLGAIGIYAIFGIILGYHWVRYSIRPAMMLLSIAFYVIGGLALILLLIGATTTLTL